MLSSEGAELLAPGAAVVVEAMAVEPEGETTDLPMDGAKYLAAMEEVLTISSDEFPTGDTSTNGADINISGSVHLTHVDGQVNHYGENTFLIDTTNFLLHHEDPTEHDRAENGANIHIDGSIQGTGFEQGGWLYLDAGNQGNIHIGGNIGDSKVLEGLVILNANNVTLAGDVQMTHLTQMEGQGDTVIGSSAAVRTFRLNGGDLQIKTHNNVTLHSEVVLEEGGNIEVEVNPASTGTAKILFNREVDVEGGDLIIHNTKRLEFVRDVNVVGGIQQTAGTHTTLFQADVDADILNLRANQRISFESFVRMGGDELTLTSNEVKLLGGPGSVIGAKDAADLPITNVLIRPIAEGVSMDIGAPTSSTGTLKFTTNDIAALANGFQSITFGYQTGGAGAVRAGQAGFFDPLTVYGGSFVINGFLHARTSMLLDASTGDIDVTGGQVRVFNQQFESVWGDSNMNLLAHQGDILLRNNGLLEIDNENDTDPAQGSVIELTATLGAIVNQPDSQGFVTARELFTTAAGDITLLTDIAQLTAHSTQQGDIDIIEFNGLHVLSAITANGAMSFDTGGDTTLDFAESQTDHPDNTLVVDVFNGNLAVGLLRFGAQGNVTLFSEGHVRGFDGQSAAHIEADLLDIAAEHGVGEPENPLLIRANQLDVENLTTGAVVLRQLSGRSQLLVEIDNQAAGAADHVSLTSFGANTVIHGTGLHSAAAAGIRVETDSALNIEAAISGQGGPLTLLAGVSSAFSAGVTASSGGGDIRFTVGTNLTMPTDAVLASQGGNLAVIVGNDVILGRLDAGAQSGWGNLALTAGGFVRDALASAAPNLLANQLRIQAGTGIGQLPTSGQERTLEIDAARLAALTNAGVIALRDINALTIGTVDSFQPEVVHENGFRTSEAPTTSLSDVRNTGGGDILLSAAGALTLTSSGDAVNTEGTGRIALIADSLSLEGSVHSSGGHLSLSAVNNISLSGTSDLLTSAAGNIAVNSSAGSLLASATSEISTGTGTVMLSAQNNMTLGTVSTAGAVGLRAVTGTLRAASGGNAERTVVSGNTLAVVAGGGVNGPGDAATAFKTNVNTLSLQGGAGALFRLLNTGTLTIDTTSASVSLFNTLMVASTLSISPYGNAVLSGAGDLSIVFDAGDGILAAGRTVSTGGSGSIHLDAGGGFLMGVASLIQTVNGAIDLQAHDDITLAKLSSVDGDITVTSATGAIVDADPAEAAVDVETAGQLSLFAETGIGIAGDDWQSLTVLLGTLRAETHTGGIFVSSTGSFATNGLISTGGDAPIHLRSGGTLTLNGNGDDVAVSAHGLLVLNAAGDLTQAEGTTLSAGQDISLSAGGTLTLAQASTPGDVALTAQTVTGIPATTPTELSANALLLEDVGAFGDPLQPLRLAISFLAGTVTGGTLAFENDGDLTLGQAVAVLTLQLLPAGSLLAHTRTQNGQDTHVNGIGEGVFAVLTGNLNVLTMPGPTFQVAEALPVLWENGGDQLWAGHFDLGGGNLTLRADGNLTLDFDATSTTGGGNTLLASGGSIWVLADSAVTTGAGSYLLSAAQDMRVDGSFSGTGDAGLLAGHAIYTEVDGGPTRLTAGDLVMRSGFRIGGNVISTEVSRLAAHSGALGIHLANTGDLVITNLGVSVPSLQPDGSVEIAFSGHLGGITTELSGAINLSTTGTLDVHEVAAVIEAFPDSEKTLSILSDLTGPDGNALSVLFEIVRSDEEPIDASDAQDDSDLRDGDPPSTKFLESEGILKVFVRNEVSTLQEIIDAINADPDFHGTAVLAAGAGEQIFTHPTDGETLFAADGGRREGVLTRVAGEFREGAEPISATAELQPPEALYILRFTATNPGAEANDFLVRLLDDGPGGRLTDAANESEVEWDVGNGLLNLWINFGHTTVGKVIDTLNAAHENDGVPFTVELAGAFGSGTLTEVLGEGTVTLRSNLAATATLRPVGANNDFKVTANVGGTLYNGITFEFLDDGSQTSGGASASFDDTINLMTLRIQSGVTTANQILAALNSEGTFTAELVQETSGGTNTGNGIVQAHRFHTRGGAVATKSSVLIKMEGSNNDLRVTADDFGSDHDGIEIRLIRDDSVPLFTAEASYNAGARILELRFYDFATAGALMEAINDGDFPLTASLPDGQSGFGGIKLAVYPKTSGGTSGPPHAEFHALGPNNDFELTAESESTSLENIEVFLIDDGTITDGSATAVYLSTPRHLILNVQSGVTTLNTLLAAINDPGSSVPVNAAALPGNDGTGVFNTEGREFFGGVDPIPATISTQLPSGVNVTLETEEGGVLHNGIRVAYGTDDTLPPGTASASYFEGDGLRLIRIRVADAATEVQAIDDALADAGLPFFVSNLSEVGAEAVGSLAPVSEGDIVLAAGNHVRLTGRVESETGAVAVSTTGGGDLTFDSETARIVAMTSVDVDVDGSFANLDSLENPLIRTYEDGIIRIVTGSSATASTEPVHLFSRGDLEIGGAGLTLQDVELEGLADGAILVSGPVSAGAAPILFDAGDTFTLTADGSLSGEDLTVTAENDIAQNGNLSATGSGVITVTSATGNLMMGAAAETTSESGSIFYTAAGNIGVTFIHSTTGGNIVLSAGGAISDTHATDGLNLSTTGSVWLTAENGIGAVGAGDLKTQSGSMRLRNLGAEGDIVITETNGTLTVTELTQKATAAGEGWAILNVEAGNALFTGAVSLEGGGSLRVISSGALHAQASVTLQGGAITFDAGGNLTLDANVSSNGGDVSAASGGVLTMAAAMTLDADGGNVYLEAAGNVFLAQVRSPLAGVRVRSLGASILRTAADGRTNVIADLLQLRAAAAIGALNIEPAALITDVNALNAIALDGALALRNLKGVTIGHSTVETDFAQDNKSFVTGSWDEARVSTTLGHAVLRIEGNLTVETILGGVPTVSVDGNLHLAADGTVMIDGDLEVTAGAAHLSSGGVFTLVGNLDVTGGTLLIETDAALTQDMDSVITVDNANAVIASAGDMDVSRVATGSGDLALTSGASILRVSDSPAVNLTAAAIRLQAGADIGAVGGALALSSARLSATAPGSLHLHAASDVAVDSVEVSVNTVSVLGEISGAALHTEAALADLHSSGGGDILMRVTGLLELFDGNGNDLAVRTVQNGNIYLQATQLEVSANIQSDNGHITLNISGTATWLYGPESFPGLGDDVTGRVLTQAGHIHINATQGITMEDGTVIRSSEGNVRLASNSNIVLGSVEATDGLVALHSQGQILDGGGTHLDVIADHLHIISLFGVGVLGASYNPIDTQVNRVAAEIDFGPFALADVGAVEIGLVQGEVTTVNLSGVEGTQIVSPRFGIESWGGGSVSLTAVGSIAVLDGQGFGRGVEAHSSDNILLHATGTGSTLTVGEDIRAWTGHITLRAHGAIAFAQDVLVSTRGAGTLTVISSNGGITQQAGATLSSVDGDVALQAAGAISLAGIETDAGVAVTSTGGAILDNEPARVNVTADRLRLNAGQSIATGANPLNVEVNTLAARTANGGIHVRGESSLTLAPVGVATRLVAPDASDAERAVATQSSVISGGTAGTIVVRAMGGNLTVTAANPVTASGAGNVLLHASQDLDLFAPVSSTSGTITLESEGNTSLAANLLVSTGSLGEVHAFSGGSLITGANSRFVANSGNVVLGAQGNVVLGGIQTTGRAAVGSNSGTILGAGSTAFNHEVVAARLLLAAPLGGVGTLSPADPALPFRTSVSRIAGVAGPAGIHVVNSIAVTVDEVVVGAQRVTSTGSLQTLPAQSLSDLTTLAGDAPIVLRTTSGSITLNEGGNANGIAVAAHGAGNVLISAAAAQTVNAGVVSEMGHVTLRAAIHLTFGAAGWVSTAAPGTVVLRAAGGNLTMAGASQALATGSAMRLRAAGDITLGNLSAAEMSVVSDNGSILRAAGATQNFTGGTLRLEANGSIGAPTNPLTTGVAALSARSREGHIYLRESGNVLVSGTGLTVHEVNNVAGTSPITDSVQSGLRTEANNGNVILVSTGGSVTVASGAQVVAHGSGRVLLEADTALTLNANVSSGFGHISLIAGNGVTLSETITVSTAAPGAVFVDAGAGSLSLPAVGGINAPGGPVRLAATGDVLIGSLIGANVSVLSTAGGIFRAAAGTNIQAGALRLNAATTIGAPAGHLRIAVGTLSARSAAGIFLTETDGVTVSSVSRETPRVNADGTLTTITDNAQADLRTTNQGDIVLVTLAGSITLNDGDADNTAVRAHGTGNVRIQAASNLNVNAGVFSGTGHLTLRAGNNVSLAAVTVETAAPGQVSVTAVNGTVGMNGLANVRAIGSTLRVWGRGNVTLANLSATQVSVVSDNGAVINASGTTRNITATRARLQTRNNIGVANRRITTAVDELAAFSQLGNIYLTELNAVQLTGVAVSVTEFSASGGTVVVNDGQLNGLVAANEGDVVLVTGGHLTVDHAFGGTVNLISGGAILAGDGSPAHVTATALLLRAQNDIGAQGDAFTVDTDVLTAHSVTGNIYINGFGDFTVGSVFDLANHADPNDVQTGVRALANEDVFLALSGDLTLGWVTGDTVSLVVDGGIFASGGGPHVDAANLRMQTGTGVGAPGNSLHIDVDVVAAFAENGDILLARPSGNLEVGSVVDAGLDPTTLSGLTTQNGGDIVLLVGGTLTVTDPVSAADNVRLSAQGNLLLGLVSGTEISLLAAGNVLNAQDLTNNLAATSLRIHAEGDIGFSTTPLTTEVDFLSAVSQHGGVWLTEAADAALASVSVAAGGQTDAAQHGVSGDTGVVLVSTGGRWLDGGDAEDDVRSPGPVILIGATGLGTTGIGALEVSTPTLTVETTGDGTVYLNLTRDTTLLGLDLAGQGNAYLHVAGDLTQSGPVTLPGGSAYITVEGLANLQASGTVEQHVRITAGTLLLDAAYLTQQGNLKLRAGGDLTMALGSTLTAANRNVQLLAGGDAVVTRILGERGVEIRVGGNLSAASANRAEHELSTRALRILVDGGISALLTDVDRLDVRAGGEVAITEANDLEIGRYGLRLVNAAAADNFALNLGVVELTAVNGVGTVTGEGTFVLNSEGVITLNTRLVSAGGTGNLLVDVESLNLTAGHAGPVLDTASGRVTLKLLTGVGDTTALPLTVRAGEFTAESAQGDLVIEFAAGVTITEDGVTLQMGGGVVNLHVAEGDMALLGRILNQGGGNIRLEIAQGLLSADMSGILSPALDTSGNIHLDLDTGTAVTGGERISMRAANHSAETRTGDLHLELRTSGTNVNVGNIVIHEGTGHLNLLATGANLFMGATSAIRNFANGNFTVRSLGAIEMSNGAVMRSSHGEMRVISAHNMLLSRIESYGTLTLFQVTVGGHVTGRSDISGPHVFTNSNHQPQVDMIRGYGVTMIVDADSVLLTDNAGNASTHTRGSTPGPYVNMDFFL